MASSSGNSSHYSGSEEGVVITLLTDERKRKRMLSNRESARRSRVRKQKHLDDLMAQVNQLRRENNQILTAISVTTQHFLKAETENSILHAQIAELTHQLHSLNGILTYVKSMGNSTAATTNNGAGAVVVDQGGDDFVGSAAGNAMLNVDPWNMPAGMMCFNQPIMVSSHQDLFQYS